MGRTWKDQKGDRPSPNKPIKKKPIKAPKRKPWKEEYTEL